MSSEQCGAAEASGLSEWETDSQRFFPTWFVSLTWPSSQIFQSATRVVPVMYSGHSAHEDPPQTIAAGFGWIDFAGGVRFGWAAAAAVAGVGEAAERFEGDAKRGSGQAYVDDSHTDNGPGAPAVSGEDAGVPNARGDDEAM